MKKKSVFFAVGTGDLFELNDGSSSFTYKSTIKGLGTGSAYDKVGLAYFNEKVIAVCGARSFYSIDLVNWIAMSGIDSSDYHSYVCSLK